MCFHSTWFIAEPQNSGVRQAYPELWSSAQTGGSIWKSRSGRAGMTEVELDELGRKSITPSKHSHLGMESQIVFLSKFELNGVSM